MPPRTTWSNLLPGLIALAVVVSIAVAVVMFGGLGRRETIRVYVLTGQAQGVMGGTEVWLEGQKVGIVERIGFRPPSTDTLPRVVLILRLDRNAAAHLRHDSRAQIRTGGSIIGPVVLYLSGGTPAAPILAHGDTLHARPQADVVASGTKLLATVTREFKPLMTDFRTVMAQARGSAAAREAFVEEHDGEVVELRGRFARLRDFFTNASSSALAVGARDVVALSQRALARTDSIQMLLNSPATSLGRFRRDSTLDRSITALRGDMSRVRAQMDSGDGTVGRFARDSALRRAMVDAQHELTLLSEDVRRRPRRYIVF